MTAREISRLPFFVAACEAMDVKPTTRQARKAKQGAGRWENHQLTACLNNVHSEAA